MAAGAEVETVRLSLGLEDLKDRRARAAAVLAQYAMLRYATLS